MNILIADDERGIRQGLKHLFLRAEYEVFEAEAFEPALECVRNNEIHVALLDIRLGDRDGVELLREIRRADSDVICLMITGYGSIGNAVEAIRAGAADYLLKPLDNEKLLEAVQSRVELKKLKTENRFLKSEQQERLQSCDFKTAHPGMRRVMEIADRVKDTEATVLITGESGTGKEVLCRYLHFTSNRKDAPFVGVNCAALSESLLLSELFGHEKGAFTGAVDRKPGKFELADRGTLFLDEIGDMSPEAQSKLLRVIEEGAFERVGGTRSIRTDIRLAAATNQDLPQLIREKRFREDLYYRLNVIRLELPPLRDRREDIPVLAEHFRQFYNSRYRKNALRFAPGVMARLSGYSWPGNVRELRNMINQAVLLSDREELDPPGFLPSAGLPADRSPGAGEGPLQDRLNRVMEEYEKEIIEQALIRHRFNRTAAAEELGITRKTLFNKIGKYGL